jgi:nickel superoxide dismutase
MNQIDQLASNDPAANANQIVRWVDNKDKHADEFAHIISYYFLQQRIKVDEKDEEAYMKKLMLCHHLLVYSMKCKHGTDKANTAKLRELVDEFHDAYFTKEDKAHMKEHKAGKHTH